MYKTNKDRIEVRKSYDLLKLKEEELKPAEDGLVQKRTYISGYAVVFNELSVDLGGFREVILPESVDQALIDNSDIVFVYNHDPQALILARSDHGTGTLQIQIDKKGIYFEFEVPETQLGHDIAHLIRRGDINQCSFSFTNSESDIREEGGEVVRYIKKIDGLYDFSIVVHPAYDATSVEVAKRSIDEFLIKKEKEPKPKQITKRDIIQSLYQKRLKQRYKLL